VRTPRLFRGPWPSSSRPRATWRASSEGRSGGSDDPSNRTTLCLWHHLRGEHAKILRCRGKAPGKLRFELGLRARREPLARYRSGDVLVS
jgi:hypothetical protein